jgi:hypothetical protein
MSREPINCKETACEYFRRYYAVIKIGDRSPTKTTNFIPDLNSIDKRCKHPDVFVPTGTSEDYGTSIHVLKQCPNEN